MRDRHRMVRASPSRRATPRGTATLPPPAARSCEARQRHVMAAGAGQIRKPSPCASKPQRLPAEVVGSPRSAVDPRRDFANAGGSSTIRSKRLCCSAAREKSKTLPACVVSPEDDWCSAAAAVASCSASSAWSTASTADAPPASALHREAALVCQRGRARAAPSKLLHAAPRRLLVEVEAGLVAAERLHDVAHAVRRSSPCSSRLSQQPGNLLCPFVLAHGDVVARDDGVGCSCSTHPARSRRARVRRRRWSPCSTSSGP